MCCAGSKRRAVKLSVCTAVRGRVQLKSGVFVESECWPRAEGECESVCVYGERAQRDQSEMR